MHTDQTAYLDVVNEDLLESSGKHVSGSLGRTETNGGHHIHSLEAPSHTIVNTFGLTPVTRQLVVSVTLMTSELLRPLLDDLRL